MFSVDIDPSLSAIVWPSVGRRVINVLGPMCPGPAVRRDQFYSAGQGRIQAIRLTGVVSNEPHRLLPDKPLREGRVDQGDFVWRGPRLVLPTQAPPRLPGAKLPSMNVSCTFR